MANSSQLNIGLIGAGIVGGGVVRNLTRNADLIAEQLGTRLHLQWVCDKDQARPAALTVAASVKTADAGQVLRYPAVQVVILTGAGSAARAGWARAARW